jgi:hypothetical protein
MPTYGFEQARSVYQVNSEQGPPPPSCGTQNCSKLLVQFSQVSAYAMCESRSNGNRY